jgi:hypothetical protein
MPSPKISPANIIEKYFGVPEPSQTEVAGAYLNNLPTKAAESRTNKGTKFNFLAKTNLPQGSSDFIDRPGFALRCPGYVTLTLSVLSVLFRTAHCSNPSLGL